MPPTKTLYTPVFFSSSEPAPPPPAPPPPSKGSRSTTTLKVPSSYLNSLSRTHIALAQLVQEVPCSRPGSPTEDSDGSYPDSETQERISLLRARVREAWRVTDGNPADGKWTVLTNLLRMNVTSGKGGRWAGTRVDVKAPEPPPESGWINAVTEAEWADWEKRVCLKDKVENWKLRLESHEELENQKGTANISNKSSSHQEEASIPIPAVAAAAQPNLKLKAAATTTSKMGVDSNPLKDNSLFGFSVIKRSNNPSMTAVIGKKPHVNSSNPVNQPPKETATATIRKKIVDFPETSFLPPSFPSSQVMTSTPNAKPISSDKRKPEPIPFTESPPLLPTGSIITPPLSSPRVTKVYGRLRQQDLLSEKSTSLPAIPLTTTTTISEEAAAALLPLPPPVPTTPTRNRVDDDDDTLNHNHKRPIDSPNRVVKKARTMPSLDSSPLPVVVSTPPPPPPPHNEDGADPVLPTTPKRQNLPTLTELLASAKKGKKKLHSPKVLKPNSATAAGVGDDSSSTKPTSKSKFRFPSPLPFPLSPTHPAPPLSPTEDNPYMLDPYAISVNHSALDLGIIDVSPTKSLSSLAGSDSSEEDDDEEDDDNNNHPAVIGFGLGFSPPSSPFNPYATSTQQHPNPKGQSSPSPYLGEKIGRARAGVSLGFAAGGVGGGNGYNSQFDIAGQIDKVDKLLEKDVDYEGWLRDPSLEREGGGGGQVGLEDSP